MRTDGAWPAPNSAPLMWFNPSAPLRAGGLTMSGIITPLKGNQYRLTKAIT
ncbi:MAG: hypothetical protein Q7K03_11030 [Dehalococcoidia bacterium]|nr:hypothetical protein [Dehalococcoidia bacterium]